MSGEFSLGWCEAAGVELSGTQGHEERAGGRWQCSPGAAQVLPRCCQGCSCRGTGLALAHGALCAVLSKAAAVCSFPSVVILVPKRGSSRAGTGGRAAEAGHGRAPGCASCAWHSGHGLGHHRGSWSEGKASATCHTCHGTAALGDRPLPACPHDECVQLSCSHTNG